MSLTLRTINAPGVEITEVDRSQYSQTLTGTKVLVAGFADRGEDFATISPTSRSTLVNVYGKPTNEAERYFYEACKEVIQQGGELYSARLAYDNEMAGTYACVNYQINPCSTTDGDKVTEYKSIEFTELPDILGDEWTEELSTKILEKDAEILAEYNLTIEEDRNPNFPPLDTDPDQANAILSILDGSLKAGSFGYPTYLSAYEVDIDGGLKYITDMDPTVRSIQKLTLAGDAQTPTTISGDKYDEYATGEDQPNNGFITIIDITRGTYGKTPFKGENDEYYKECIGIVPIITTAGNALFTQMLLSSNAEAEAFNVVAGGINSLNAANFESVKKAYPELSNQNNCFTLSGDDLAIPLGGEGTADGDFQKAFRDSLTARANAYFPSMYTEVKGNTNVFNREQFKKIGIVVFKAFIDPAYNNKVNFDAVEAFVGSLDPQGTDLGTGANNFIDNIVNTQSEYIRVFSNAKPDEKADILMVDNQPAASLGFYASMTVKNVNYRKIMEGLNKVFDRNSDINEKEIDIVVDAGVSTIASYLNGDESRLFDPTGPGNSQYTLKGGKANWRGVLEKYDNFCKNTRKDCMFVADGMRQFCLQGKKKIVRPSKPENTIDTKIIPNLLDMQVLNTNYGAGYCDWFEVVDEFSGDTFWCPPSIKATGVYIYTDRHANYWDAPAGLNRGMVSANDVAFNPNVIQAGPIYLKNWNYAINYPVEGVILEGQKTMQIKPSAFDRINVRRLFLRLERFVYSVARYFVYEINNQYTRNRLIDALNPYFSQVKTAGGIYDYKIICDESINTPQVIDNNELRIRIGAKPSKVAEFVLIEFVALRTGASWSEITNI